MSVAHIDVGLHTENEKKEIKVLVEFHEKSNDNLKFVLLEKACSKSRR